MQNSGFVAVAIAACFCTSAYAQDKTANPPANPDLFRMVEGTWGWKDPELSSCEKNPHTLKFVEQNKKMHLTHKSGSLTVYQVLYAEKNQLTMLIEDETRRTDVGDRVVWVLVLNDRNSYQWRRTDWKPEGRTKEIVRCQGR